MLCIKPGPRRLVAVGPTVLPAMSHSYVDLHAMWVVKTTNVLEMEGPPPVHEELLKAGWLVRQQSIFSTIFVSHQWLGAAHPDKAGLQFRILRLCIQNILSGSLKLSMGNSAAGGRSSFWQDGLSPAEIGKLHGSYIWLDWFCIPQHGTKKDFALAVQSIPSFVDASEFFLALVPTIPHADTGDHCSFTTWLDARSPTMHFWFSF